MKRRRITVLEDLVRKAIGLGAEIVEVEYRDGFEEVVAYRGVLGRQLARLRAGSADAAALGRDLYAWKVRPRRISVGGEDWLVRTEVWDSFGEDAFRITPERRSQPLRRTIPQKGRRRIEEGRSRGTSRQ
ncbi:MAG: hypothetical protein AB1726_00500 [Planctomycetota bacterium]